MNVAKTVTVHCSVGVRLAFGVMTQVRPPLVLPRVAALCWPELTHEMSNQSGSTETGSVKSTCMLGSFGAVVDSKVGSVDSTDGPISWIGVVILGLGVPVEKSE